jgi:beta-glucosidase-like glycosyl hydrolase
MVSTQIANDLLKFVQAMVPYKPAFLQDAVTAVEQGYVPEARIDLAVDRILDLKRRVGLLHKSRAATLLEGRPAKVLRSEDAAANGSNGDRMAHNGIVAEEVRGRVDSAMRSAEDEQSAAAAADGIVLLKNRGGVLPLCDGAYAGGSGDMDTRQEGGEGTIAVVGPTAKSAANLVGAWSVHWTGPDSEAEVRLQ